MKCPKCGAEISGDHMYCDKCGTEINMVPEFEPLIENKIDEVLSDIADKLNIDTENKNKDKHGKKENNPVSLPILIGIVVACIILIFIINLAGRNSASHYITLANQAIAENDYEQALSYLQTAKEKSPDNSDIVFSIAEYQVENGYTEDAINSLMEITISDNFTKDDKINAYKSIIKLYKDLKDFESIVQIVKDCPYDEITEEYSFYIPVSPVLVPSEGTYEEALSISISSSSIGNIYYTVNGQEPTEDSIQYFDEIVLQDDGTYDIKAVLINQYGIKSDVSEEIYVIEIGAPEAPEILEDSGEYNQNTSIVALADSDCTIYYTTDGSDPDETSTQYISPITMPVGTSTYKFIAIDSDGRKSEIVERNYHLVYTRLVSTTQAIENVVSTLLKLDILLDGNKMRSEEGYFSYTFDSIIEIEGSGEYYKIVENHVYNDGTSKETGLFYAVNTHDGTVNRLGYDSSGKYTLITISNR
ncbi:MAG: chitobiase/beta-hexosaminidase C-terminal domain-containing protein [Butyrivibrio sp.]|nr:chitobiase/beta-hexosaminidase C-terminal domain-containing protein [Butyrivibrio sp.]